LHSRGLIHRDIKPANIIFVNGAAKFADIGLVTEIASTGREVTYVGTEGYMPPEGPGKPGGTSSAWASCCMSPAPNGLFDFPALPDGVRDWPDRGQVFELNEIVLRLVTKTQPNGIRRQRKCGWTSSGCSSRAAMTAG
jgi:serine/threonine protein kinase